MTTAPPQIKFVVDREFSEGSWVFAVPCYDADCSQEHVTLFYGARSHASQIKPFFTADGKRVEKK